MRYFAIAFLLALSGCGAGQRASDATQARVVAIEASGQQTDPVSRYTERVGAGDEFRVDLILRKHASGEISDKDLVEVMGQIHKKALSRINADKTILVMERERRDAALQLAEALKINDHNRILELQDKLDALTWNHRILQSELELKKRAGELRPEVLDKDDHKFCLPITGSMNVDLWAHPRNGVIHNHKHDGWPKMPDDWMTNLQYKHDIVAYAFDFLRNPDAVMKWGGKGQGGE